MAIFHPGALSSPAADSLVTHVSAGLSDGGLSGANSDALSEVLSLPEPTTPTRKKRKPGLNSKAIALTDDETLSSMKEKEVEKAKVEADKLARKIEHEQKKKERTGAKAPKKMNKRKKRTNEKWPKQQGVQFLSVS